MMCPRCAKNRLKGDSKDALSRRHPVSICSDCGVEEAMIDYSIAGQSTNSLKREIGFLNQVIYAIKEELEEYRLREKERGGE